MQKGVGVICLVIGVLLIVWGHNMANAVAGRLLNFFTGSPGERPLWLYLSGAVLVVIGLFQIFSAKK